MSRAAYVRAWPRDPATGASGLVAMAGGGSHVPYLLGSVHYRAGIVREPRFRAALGFDDKGWNGSALPTASVMAFAPADPALLRAYASLYWKDATIEVDAGEEYAGVGRILTGRIADAEVRDGQLYITVADLGAAIAKPVIQSWFAGTGGIEGDAAAEGRVKRRSYGYVKGIEGFPLLAAYNIYEFGDPARPSQDMPVIRHKGRDGDRQVLGWQGSIAATLEALKAAQAPQGGGVVAPSINCAKWWTDPQGAPLTAHIMGDNAAGYVDRPAAIASRLLDAAGGPAIANLGDAVAMRNVQSGIHIGDDSETTAAALDRLLLPISLLWRFGTIGLVDIREWSWDGAAEVVQGRFLGRNKTLPPTRTRRLGYEKNHRVHGTTEIAADVLAAGAAYEDGTPIEQLRPAEAGANITGNHTSAAFAGQGSLATRNDVIFGSHITSLPAAIAPSNLIDGQYLSAGFGRYLDGVTLQMLRPGEVGANVTEGRVSAAFQGQGLLATLNGLAFGSPLLSGFGSLAGLGNLFFGSPFFLEGAGGATATLSAFKTIMGVASGFLGQTSWATYGGSIASLTSPQGNLFPYPRPTRDDRAPSSYGWGRYVYQGDGSGWGDVVKYDGNSNGGAIYVVSRSGNFGACTLVPYFDVALRDAPSWINGQRKAAISLAGYASNGSFVPIADWINADRNQTFERVNLSYNPTTNRYEGVLSAAPQGAAYIRVYAGHTNFPAFNGYQDVCFWNIKVEPDAVTPYSDISENRSGIVEWGTGQLLNALRPGEFGANVTEGRTAAGIFGQSAWATLGITTNRIGKLGDDGNMASSNIFQSNVGWLNNFWPQEGGANVTEGRTASAIFGQSAWATFGVSTNRVSRLQDDGLIEGGAIFKSNIGWLNDFWPDETHSNRTQNNTAAALQGQGPWATYSRGIADLTAQRSNLFPYPRPRTDSLQPSSYGWQNAGQGHAGASAMFNGGPSSWGGGMIYIMPRPNGGGAADAYPFFDVGVQDLQGRQIALSLNGYVGGSGTFAPYLEWMNGQGGIMGNTLLAYNSTTDRWEGISPPMTSEVRTLRVVAKASWPASGSYQDLVFWAIQMELDRVTPYTDGAGGNQPVTNVRWENNLGLNQLRPEEAGGNRTEGRTAAAFSGQGAFATQSWINSGNVASFFSYNAFRLSYNITRFDGSTIVSESMVITYEGISAGFIGQGIGATANNLGQLDPGAKADLDAAKGARPVYGANDVRRVFLNPGQSVACEGGIYLNAGGTGGTFRSQLSAGPAGSTRAVFATGEEEYAGPNEPGFSYVSGGFTNNTGTRQMFEIAITAARNPSSTGGSVNLSQSYHM